MTRWRSVKYGDTTIEYEVRRSRRRKKTVYISVDGNGVHVSAPMTTTNRFLEEMVLGKAPWILNGISRMGDHALPRRFESGEKFPYLGRSIRLVVEPAAVRGARVRFDHWRLLATVPRRLEGEKRSDAVRRVVVGWYRSRASERLNAGVDKWWSRLGRGDRSQVLVRDHRRQWGSCAHDGTLRFSWRLMMVEPDLVEYVVVHELAHLTHRNHSANFWELVYQVMPDARERRKRLDEAARLLPIL